MTAPPVFGCGAGVGVATATARGGGGVAASDAVPRASSIRDAGVFAGFGVSSSSRASLDFAVFLVLRAVSFSWDFFFAPFGLGVGVWWRFDFGEALGSGVSRGVGAGIAPSSSFFDSSLASFAFGIAAVAFSVGEARFFVADL